MTASIIQFLISTGVIVAAGAALTQFADAISHKTKFGRMMVGSLLLAGATSLPELLILFISVRNLKSSPSRESVSAAWQ